MADTDPKSTLLGSVTPKGDLNECVTRILDSDHVELQTQLVAIADAKDAEFVGAAAAASSASASSDSSAAAESSAAAAESSAAIGEADAVALAPVEAELLEQAQTFGLDWVTETVCRPIQAHES